MSLGAPPYMDFGVTSTWIYIAAMLLMQCRIAYTFCALTSFIKRNSFHSFFVRCKAFRIVPDTQ